MITEQVLNLVEDNVHAGDINLQRARIAINDEAVNADPRVMSAVDRLSVAIGLQNPEAISCQPAADAYKGSTVSGPHGYDQLIRPREIPEKEASAPPVEPAYFTVKQATIYSGLTEKMIWRLLDDGTLTRHRVRRRVLVSRAQLDAAIKGEQ